MQTSEIPAQSSSRVEIVITRDSSRSTAVTIEDAANPMARFVAPFP